MKKFIEEIKNRIKLLQETPTEINIAIVGELTLVNKRLVKINSARCCTEFKTDKEKDAFDEGYRKGWVVGVSVE